MNAFFKRSAISLVIAGLTGSAIAAMPSHVNNSTWWPQIHGVFIGADALYLRPQNGDLDYVTINARTVTEPYLTQGIFPGNKWDWRAYGGINFSDNDDITFSWLHYAQSFGRFIVPQAFTTYTPRWLPANPWNLGITSTARFELDEAYAVWGHTINLNNPWSLRFAGGFEYATLNSDLSVTGTTTDTINLPVLPFYGYKASSDLQGWGARLELDATYHLPYGLAAFLRTNAVLLSAARSVSLNEIDTGSVDSLLSASFSKHYVVVPKFGMKIGASYSHYFGQSGAEGVCGGTILTLELGWQADAYIHAIERPVAGHVTTAVAPTMDDTFVSNFSMQGLFAGLKISADWL